MSWTAFVFYAFILVTAKQLFYYLYFFRRVAVYHSKEKEHSQQHPVSVVICARDEDENIARNLPGKCHAPAQPDSGGRDHSSITPKIARTHLPCS